MLTNVFKGLCAIAKPEICLSLINAYFCNSLKAYRLTLFSVLKI